MSEKIKITDNEYVKIHADFCNRLGRFVNKYDKDRSIYSKTMVYLLRALDLAIKDDYIASMMTAYLTRTSTVCDENTLMPILINQKWTIEEYREMNELIALINFDFYFSRDEEK